VDLMLALIRRVGVAGLDGAAAEGRCGAATSDSLKAAQWLCCGTLELDGAG
jgi:hypothetical protein